MLIEVDINSQTLTAFDDAGNLLMETNVSTAKAGVGEVRDSNCTPRGWHIVRAKIGCGMPPNTVFRARRPTNELYSRQLRKSFPARDWILTRILWLSGIEPGFNRLGDVDTMRRYIYIHGCPDDDAMGVPGSKGCIKMRNHEVIDLYDRVEVGTLVNILSE